MQAVLCASLLYGTVLSSCLGIEIVDGLHATSMSVLSVSSVHSHGLTRIYTHLYTRTYTHLYTRTYVCTRQCICYLDSTHMDMTRHDTPCRGIALDCRRTGIRTWTTSCLSSPKPTHTHTHAPHSQTAHQMVAVTVRVRVRCRTRVWWTSCWGTSCGQTWRRPGQVQVLIHR